MVSPGFCFGAVAFHSVYNTTKLCYPESQPGSSPLRRWHTHIYVSFTTPDTCRSLNQLRDCLLDVSLWMKNSKLKLNADKTEFLIIGTSTQRAKLDGFFPTQILSQSITLAAQFLILDWWKLQFQTTYLENMSLLFLPYPWSSPYPPVYNTFRC